ncbi:MAG: protein disulfide oxidoreductase [Thiogranum sp.]
MKQPIARHGRWLRRAFEATLFIGIIFAIHLYQTRNTLRGEAPLFSARLLDGSPVSMQGFRGRPLLLQFWATWCPVCSLEQGSIDAIARDHAVLSVAIDDASADEIREWMSGKGVSYAVIPDPSGQISARFGVQGVPTSMIIDASGIIRFVEAGYTTETGLRLRLWWVGI